MWLNCCGPIPAFSCAALHPAPVDHAVYFLLCGKWMSLPWLKCWCAAKSSPFWARTSGGAVHLLSWIQLHATLLDRDVLGCTVTSAYWDTQCMLVEAFEGISEVEKHRCNCVMLLKRVWRWITGRHKLNYEPRSVFMRWGRSKAVYGHGVPVSACSAHRKQPVDVSLEMLFKCNCSPWCAW